MSKNPVAVLKGRKRAWSKPCLILGLLCVTLRMTMLEYWARESQQTVASAVRELGNWVDKNGVNVQTALFATKQHRSWLWIQIHTDGYGPLLWSDHSDDYYVDGQTVEDRLNTVATTATRDMNEPNTPGSDPALAPAVLSDGVSAEQRLHSLMLWSIGLEVVAVWLYSIGIVMAWQETRSIEGDPPVSAIGRGATVLEDSILPAVYLYLAWTVLAGTADLDLFNASGFWSRSWQDWTKPETAGLISSAMLFAIQFSIGIFLFINRRPAARYRTLAEIVVPLLAAFFFITYDYTYLLPKWMTDSLIANDPRQEYIAFIGLIFGALGGAVSVWGLMSLGRSFGILVAVRKVVLRGPYRFIRHPIYLGYFLALFGMLLADPEPIYFALIPTLYLIMSWRARLEESKLASVSMDYRENMTRTGMFFPRMPWQRRMQYVPEGFAVLPVNRGA